jgi:hypothetical protein
MSKKGSQIHPHLFSIFLINSLNLSILSLTHFPTGHRSWPVHLPQKFLQPWLVWPRVAVICPHPHHPLPFSSYLYRRSSILTFPLLSPGYHPRSTFIFFALPELRPHHHTTARAVAALWREALERLRRRTWCAQPQASVLWKGALSLGARQDVAVDPDWPSPPPVGTGYGFAFYRFTLKYSSPLLWWDTTCNKAWECVLTWQLKKYHYYQLQCRLLSF